MQQETSNIWKDAIPNEFVRALTLITDEDLMRNFLRDVMTEKEIQEISARLEAARMLADGQKYSDIIIKTKLSSRTVARISSWMQNGTGGYAAVLALLLKH